MRKIIGQPPSLPVQPSTRAVRGGGARETISVQLEVVTPILGGAVATRDVDGVDIIRVPTIRGHLRFWWRALYGHNHGTSQALYDAEKALWGGATDTRNDAGSARSGVEVRVRVDRSTDLEDTVQTFGEYDHCPGPNDTLSYVLWIARKQDPQGRKVERRDAAKIRLTRPTATRFALRLVLAPDGNGRRDFVAEVRSAAAAWILFGGYGSRTRRGVGSLAAADGAGEWQPEALTAAELERMLGPDLWSAAGGRVGDLPSLRGAALWAGTPAKRAEAAWETAVGWLKGFRSDLRKGAGGRSKYEAVTDLRELGLPLESQAWDTGHGLADRLASPLIIKPVATAKGFVPIALWLNRAGPTPALRAEFGSWIQRSGAKQVV